MVAIVLLGRVATRGGRRGALQGELRRRVVVDDSHLIINNATTGVITGNPSGMPNRLLYKSTL